MQLYKRLCQSVGLSVGLSGVIKLKKCKFLMLQLLLCVCNGEGLGVGGWGEAGSWMPLPTRPQQYCDPASLVFLGATKHLHNWLCSLVGWLVGRSVGRVTHSFDNPHVAPYWPTWPCSFMNVFCLLLSD